VLSGLQAATKPHERERRGKERERERRKGFHILKFFRLPTLEENHSLHTGSEASTEEHCFKKSR